MRIEWLVLLASAAVRTKRLCHVALLVLGARCRPFRLRVAVSGQQQHAAVSQRCVSCQHVNRRMYRSAARGAGRRLPRHVQGRVLRRSRVFRVAVVVRDYLLHSPRDLTAL